MNKKKCISILFIVILLVLNMVLVYSTTYYDCSPNKVTGVGNYWGGTSYKGNPDCINGKTTCQGISTSSQCKTVTSGEGELWCEGKYYYCPITTPNYYDFTATNWIDRYQGDHTTVYNINNNIYFLSDGSFKQVNGAGTVLKTIIANAYVNGIVSVRGVDYDTSGNLYVMVYDGVSPLSIKKFDSNGNLLKTWAAMPLSMYNSIGAIGGDNIFLGPAVDKNGYVYVAAGMTYEYINNNWNYYNHIYKYDNSGNLIKYLKSSTQNGDLGDIFIGTDGIVYIESQVTHEDIFDEGLGTDISYSTISSQNTLQSASSTPTPRFNPYVAKTPKTGGEKSGLMCESGNSKVINGISVASSNSNSLYIWGRAITGTRQLFINEYSKTRTCATTETCGNNVDDDCNCKVDDGCCACSGTSCQSPGNTGKRCNGCIYVAAPAEDCSTSTDDDCDGVLNDGCCTCSGTGCNTANTQVCNGCNWVQATNVYYYDADGDGYGNPSHTYNSPIQACSQPREYVANNQDCNDADATIKIGAAEVCDGIDNNCVNGIDEGVKNACGSCGAVPSEACDGQDNNCNGQTDENCRWCCDDDDNDARTTASNFQMSCADSFEKQCSSVCSGGGGITSQPSCSTELNSADNDATVYPGAPEICDGKDNNGVNGIDEGTSCSITTYYCDSDGDGYKSSAASGTCSAFNCVPSGCTTTQGNDCRDDNANVKPNAAEACDGIDNNCANGVDENCRWCCDDDDGDGYITSPLFDMACPNPPSDYEKQCSSLSTAKGGGCIGGGGFTSSPNCRTENTPTDGRDANTADGDATTYPGAQELCDGKDNNGVNGIDENNPCSAGQTCQNGACKINPGGLCTSPSSCTTGYCVEGKCNANKQLSADCANPYDCASNICKGNKCGSNKANSQPCTYGYECASNLCKSGSCGEDRANGANCVSSVECASNFCKNLKCNQNKDDGSSCTATYECKNEYCVHNICRNAATSCGDLFCDPPETQDSCQGDCCVNGDHDPACCTKQGGVWLETGKTTDKRCCGDSEDNKQDYGSILTYNSKQYLCASLPDDPTAKGWIDSAGKKSEIPILLVAETKGKATIQAWTERALSFIRDKPNKAQAVTQTQSTIRAQEQQRPISERVAQETNQRNEQMNKQLHGR